MTETTTMHEQTAPANDSPTANRMPMFYQQIEAFDTTRHADLCRQTQRDFRFAAEATVIPVVISELPQLLRHYPLVFIPSVDGGSPGLAVLVGLGDGPNLFVNSQSAWLPDTYIPAYVRRYPFHALRIDMETEPLLAIDPTALITGYGEPLVDTAGEPSSYVREMLAFTQEYRAAAERTETMCQALLDAGVLQDGDITLQTASGEVHRINGFLSVDEARLRLLPAEALIKLHGADALGLAYAQLLSLVNLTHLPRSTAEKSQEKTIRSKKKPS